MAKDNIVVMDGEVVECCGGTFFKVKMTLESEDPKEGEENSEMIVLCHPSGRMRQNSIKILLGDTVTVEMSTYDREKGRITRRK